MGVHYDIGIDVVAERLTETLRQYIEAQYHIRDESLIAERHALLGQVGAIWQRPYVEATPVYELGKSYGDLNIPRAAKDLLGALVPLGIGVYRAPYMHQAEALEQFCNGRDVIVATGTGSGKTETFLMPILATLAIEAEERPLTAGVEACRALLLYPMNALVNDQLSRIRRLLGNVEAARIVSAGRGRYVRFATYTGRTPYPGKRSASRDSLFIKPLFEDYYLKLLEGDGDIVRTLVAKGKWPSKDLIAFYNAARIEYTKYRSGTKIGKTRAIYHWDERLITSDGDRELLTRDESQKHYPDVLITNYSMLEYMLMRPIERSIFRNTKDWLELDGRNEFTLVVDEAHLYYGAAGAEVALLIRRLMARLGIPRERMRCILTSASLGAEASESDALRFAAALTGLKGGIARDFVLVTGSRERRSGVKIGDAAICAALESVDVTRLEAFSSNLESSKRELSGLSRALGWPLPDPAADEAAFRSYLFENLTGFGPAENLIELCSGRAITLDALGAALFPSPSTNEGAARRATAALLALCTIARRGADGRVFLPARVHLFFRGLPGLYACINRDCDKKRVDNPKSIAGRLYTEPRIGCSCQRHGRIYELLTHRDCGSAFIRAYISGWNGAFLWSEAGHRIAGEDGRSVQPIELLIDGDPHPNEEHACRRAWIDVTSGRIEWTEPPDLDGFCMAWAPGALRERSDKGFSFSACPVCRRQWNVDAPKIMNHETKGEDPFAALTASQLRLQPPSKPQTPELPNAGRKVLLFSDGRQKAARLARDIPRAVEQDVFRQALAVAASRLNAIGKEARPNNELYVGFLDVLARNNLLLFDGSDRDRLANDLKSLARDYPDDLRAAVSDLAADLQPPDQYFKHLLRQLCARFYSLTDVTVGYVKPVTLEMGALAGCLSERFSLSATDLLALSVAWIDNALDTFSFNSRIGSYVRRQAAGYNRSSWGFEGKFAKLIREALTSRIGLAPEQVEDLERTLSDSMTQQVDDAERFLEPRKLQIVIDLNHHWFQCTRCTRLAPVAFKGHCIYCGWSDPAELDPSSSTYIQSRKGYWRTPVRRALEGERLESVSVEEHTAQLSHRDKTNVYATTERYELRFQDLLIGDDRPIDVLSCTTTMEVGVDIGSLLAIGLRNVPPQRSNYQQRAGRTGRRGSAVSTVLTYAQNGPHDSYYFHNPELMIAGEPKTPKLKLDNAKIARRHINSFLFQSFFNEAIDKGDLIPNGDTSALDKSLGRTDEFFHGTGVGSINLDTFSDWVQRRVIAPGGDLRRSIASWLPDTLQTGELSQDKWIAYSGEVLLKKLAELKAKVPLPGSPENTALPTERDGDDDEPAEAIESLADIKEQLLEFLFDANLLPSYAFPTHLAGFLIEEPYRRDDFIDVRIRELPQQSMDKALSEYAPGRLVVVNKITYRSGGVVASVLPNVEDRAAPLFQAKKTLVYCSECTYVQERETILGLRACPVCGGGLEEHETIQPEVFLPEGMKPIPEDDRDQEITYATMAQFPVPVGDDLGDFRNLGVNCEFTYAIDRRLVTVNKGLHEGGTYTGFLVCSRCGAATLEPDPPTYHDRPYLRPHRAQSRPRRCTGSFENVYLGNVFTTDLLLIRFKMAKPVVFDTTDARSRQILEDCLHTVSEALVMAAARHRELDVNPRELGSGFRIIPGDDAGARTMDVYIFDTSSGGAGYAEIAAMYINEIVKDAIELLDHCPGDCDRSCQECLRHYYNQHFQYRLDRRLGAQFLRYTVDGTIPNEADDASQIAQLRPLARYLSLEGYNCSLGAKLGGHVVPLTVSYGTTTVAIGTFPALIIEADPRNRPWERAAGVIPMLLREYELLRDTPGAQRRVTQMLDK